MSMKVPNNHLFFLYIYYEVTSFGRASFTYSAVQQLVDFPWSLAYIRKLDFGSPWGNLPVLCAQNGTYGAQEYNIKLAHTPLNYAFIVISEAFRSFYPLVPEQKQHYTLTHFDKVLGDLYDN